MPKTKTAIAKKVYKIQVTTEVELRFDPESKEFQESFESYKDLIDTSADMDNMLEQVAFSIIKFGSERMIEGVGYISVKGDKRKIKHTYSGIEVADDTPDFQTEIISRHDE